MSETNAEGILRRLLDAVERAWDEDSEHMKNTDEDAWLACRDARAYLLRKKGPVAEGYAEFHKDSDGEWRVQVWSHIDETDNEGRCVHVVIPVPAHIVSPPTVEGSVVDEA